MSSDVRAEVSAQGPPVTVQQNLEIPSRLRRLDDAECVFLIRHGQVESVVARDLEEHARVRSALIGLAGRVQETRSELQARRVDCRASYESVWLSSETLSICAHLRPDRLAEVW